MRRWIPLAMMVCLGALAAAGCGGDPGSPENLDPGDGAVETTPGCPFDAAQVTRIVGMTMIDKGGCRFDDERAVAFVTVVPGTRTAADATYDFQRNRAGEVFDVVRDLDRGQRSYLAVGEVEAEVVVVDAKASYTITMHSFELSADGYEQTLLKLLDAAMK